MAPPFHSASLSERYVKDRLYGRRWSDGFSSLSYCYLICIYTHLAFPSTNQTTTPDLPNTFSTHPTSLYTSKPFSILPQKPTKNHHKSHKFTKLPFAPRRFPSPGSPLPPRGPSPCTPCPSPGPQKRELSLPALTPRPTGLEIGA